MGDLAGGSLVDDAVANDENGGHQPVMRLCDLDVLADAVGGRSMISEASTSRFGTARGRAGRSLRCLSLLIMGRSSTLMGGEGLVYLSIKARRDRGSGSSALSILSLLHVTIENRLAVLGMPHCFDYGYASISDCGNSPFLQEGAIAQKAEEALKCS